MHGFILNMHFLWDLWGYKMKVSNKIIAAVLLLSMSAGITTGCKDSEITPEQNEWVSQIEQWYPDDEFTYNGHAVRLMGRDEGVIMLGSKLFPDESFEVYESNGAIWSTYPAMYHKKAAEEYFAGIVKDAFECDSVETEYHISSIPCEYVSDEEFIANYMQNVFTIELRYDAGKTVTQEEMVSQILYFSDGLGSDADLYFYVCYGSEPRDDAGPEPNYRIVLADGNINSFHVRKNGEQVSEELFSNMPLKDALTEYKKKLPLFTLDEEPDMDKLKEQYPEFFEHDGPPAKGIEVYVWQTAEDSYWFGLMYGTNRSKTEEEIWALGETPLTLNEAKALLNECGVDKDGIFIIPVIQPFSSYAYEIDDGYRERVRKMFGLEE